MLIEIFETVSRKCFYYILAKRTKYGIMEKYSLTWSFVVFNCKNNGALQKIYIYIYMKDQNVGK